MSCPFSRSSVESQLLILSRSNVPSFMMPTLVTDVSCAWWCAWCDPSSSARKAGSFSMIFSRSKAPIPSTLSSATSAFVQGMISAILLILRSRPSTSLRYSGVTRSVLFSSSLSAYTTCSTASFSAPSAFSSSRCCTMCLASTRVRTASTRACALTLSSMKNVWITGAGSAIPVVSIRMASSLVLRFRILFKILIRSPLTVQQMQPLFISKISSWVSKRCFTRESSMPTSPNSFSITATLRPWFCVRMWLSNVVLPAPRKPVSTVTGILSSRDLLLPELESAASADMDAGGRCSGKTGESDFLEIRVFVVMS
mmetsp:Transcript_51907/g.105689  ORF Transcript_51907/g.105689 Transcript_51907/m.105689 type:complete len:312 (-) Transcript_51907:6-941(-)